MRTFVINFLIAIGIVNIFFDKNPSVTISASNAFLAFIVTYFLLWLLSYFYDRSHFAKVPLALNLFFYFLKELFKANIKVAYEVITPQHYMNPGVIAYPMEAKSNLEITLLANFISLTPGTLTIDVSEDRKMLYFHALYIKNNDMDKIKTEIRNGFEKKILRLTR